MRRGTIKPERAFRLLGEIRRERSKRHAEKKTEPGPAYGIMAIDSAGLYVRIHVQDGQPTAFQTRDEAARHIALHLQDIRRCGYDNPTPIKVE